MMTENKKNQEFKIRKIKRGIERSCDNAKKYFWLFVVFFVAGLIVRNVMHDFSVPVLIRGKLTRN